MVSVGDKFGRLVVVSDLGIINGHRMSECVCNCGNKVIVRNSSLSSGNTQSCGCLRLERSISAMTKHGQSKSRLYRIYVDIKTRCYTPTHINYHNYGGRGIKVCEEWLGEQGSTRFIEWALSNGYSDSLSIDRIDVDGNYSPSNCRWSTIKEQSNNKRTNIRYTYNGETKTIAEWAETWGVAYWWARHWMLKIGINEVVKVVNGEKVVRTRAKRGSKQINNHS